MENVKQIISLNCNDNQQSKWGGRRTKVFGTFFISWYQQQNTTSKSQKQQMNAPHNDCNKAMVISCTGYTIEHTPSVKLRSF